MYSIEKSAAMGIVLFTIVSVAVSYDVRGNLITNKQYLEAFTSLSEAEAALESY